MPAVEVLREVAAQPGIRVEVATVEVTDQAEDGAATVPVLVARIAA